MQPTAITHESGSTLATEVLLGVALVLGLIGYSVIEYPGSIGEGGTTALLTTVVSLVAYGVAAAWMRQHGMGATKAALISGARVGLILGAVEIANISLETSGSVSQPVRGIVGPVAMGMMAVLFGSAGSIAYRRTTSLALAILAGVWCALIATIIACLFAFAFNLGFLSHMTQAMYAEYLQSGMHDARAFVVRNTLDAASSHLVVSPLIAAFFSCLGGVITARLRQSRRSAATALGILGLFQITLSIGLIHYALSLTRPERPPFIMAGMLLGGIAMTYVFPVASALLAWQSSEPR